MDLGGNAITLTVCGKLVIPMSKTNLAENLARYKNYSYLKASTGLSFDAL